MISVQLLHELDNVDTKHKIRFYEKIKKRILLTNYDIYFNQLCLNERLYPIFTNIYMYILVNLGWRPSFIHVSLNLMPFLIFTFFSWAFGRCEFYFLKDHYYFSECSNSPNVGYVANAILQIENKEHQNYGRQGHLFSEQNE